jgi:hypothetical protein
MPANTITEAKSSPRSQRVDVELVDDHVGHGLLGDQTVGRMCVAVDVVDDQGAADPINGVLLFELHVSGVEAAHEAHLDDSTPQRHFGVEHGLGFGLAGGERLPAQDRFTGFEPEHQLLGVHGVGRGDHHRVDIIGVEDLWWRRNTARTESAASAAAPPASKSHTALTVAPEISRARLVACAVPILPTPVTFTRTVIPLPQACGSVEPRLQRGGTGCRSSA